MPALQQRRVVVPRALPRGPHGAAAAGAGGQAGARRAALAVHAPLRQLPVLHQRHPLAAAAPAPADLAVL